ncbi:MFS transporter [Amycolatopsis pigmentata]|uniref:MFS transporter n=1 Tax=Amycolatopsis pigmentata TaxID=450801 RepID=A0ABW5FLW7_9PSEU
MGSRPAALPERPTTAPHSSAVRRRFHLVVMLAGVGFGLTAPFTALLVVALGGPPEWAAYVVSSMGLSLLLVDFLGTRFVPRLSSRTALTVSMVVFGAGSLLSAATTSWEMVGLARVLQGFGAALFMGGGVVLAVRLGEARSRGGAIGAFNAAWFVGIAAGPLSGGLIAATVPGAGGLRLLFAVCGVLNLAGAVAAWFLVPRWRSGRSPRLGLPAGLGLRGRRGWSVLILAGFGQAVRGGLALTLVPLLGARLGMGWITLGFAMFALALTDVGAMRFGGAWTDRRGRLVPLAGALAWGVLAVIALAAVVRSPWEFTVAALAVGVTVGTTWVVPTVMVVDIAADPDTALAGYRIASDLGMLAGGLLSGVGIAIGGVDTALFATAALLAVGLLLTFAVGETLPAHSVVVPLESRPVKENFVPVSSMPSLEEFTVFAANSGITLTPERLAQAYATHTRYRPDLERLRALPLPFTEPVTEPATGLAWIAGGGHQ